MWVPLGCPCAEGKPLSLPPGEYGRKAETPGETPGAAYLKELAGEHHKGWSLRFNWSQRPEPYPGRQQNEGRAEDPARQAERWCMAVAGSYREASG